MRGLPWSAELLAQSQGLSGLHTLRLDDRAGRRQPAKRQRYQGVCQLTGLRELSMVLYMPSRKYGADPAKSWDSPFTAEDLRLLLRLTQLQQLTAFQLLLNDPYLAAKPLEVRLTSEVSKCSS